MTVEMTWRLPNVLPVTCRPHPDGSAGGGEVPTPFDSLPYGLCISRNQGLAAAKVIDGQLHVRSKIDLQFGDILEYQGARGNPEGVVLSRRLGFDPLKDVVDVQSEFEGFLKKGEGVNPGVVPALSPLH